MDNRTEIVRALRRVADDQHRAGWDDEADMYNAAADMLEADARGGIGALVLVQARADERARIMAALLAKIDGWVAAPPPGLYRPELMGVNLGLLREVIERLLGGGHGADVLRGIVAEFEREGR